jgi:pimeloyl-ACP methyl ester carboxylesterase
VPKVDLKSGVRLHYQRIGEGPDLVMIHGLTGNLAVWHLNIIPQISHSYRTLTYDLRGHGYSDMTPTGYSGDAMAQDLLELLDALGIERPSLVGHSYGADIALYFALNHPDRVSEVVAIEAALPALVHARNRDEWEGWDHWADVLERSGVTVPPEHRSDAVYLLRASLDVPKKWGPLAGLPRNPKPFLRLIEETTVAAEYEEVGSLTLDRIPEIQTPVLLMYADGAAFLGTHEYLAAHLPNAESIILPSTEWGHFGPLEQPDVVAAHLVEFLGRRELAAEAVGE